MHSDYRPDWIDKFACVRGCSKSFTLQLTCSTQTGVKISVYTCVKCQDQYTIRWTQENPGKFIICDRTVMSRNKNGHKYRRRFNGFDLPDDLALH